MGHISEKVTINKKNRILGMRGVEGRRREDDRASNGRDRWRTMKLLGTTAKENTLLFSGERSVSRTIE
jgi:hypothetical protein